MANIILNPEIAPGITYDTLIWEIVNMNPDATFMLMKQAGIFVSSSDPEEMANTLIRYSIFYGLPFVSTAVLSRVPDTPSAPNYAIVLAIRTKMLKLLDDINRGIATPINP